MIPITSRHALAALLATPVLATAATASAASPADQIAADPGAVARLSAGLLGVSPAAKMAVAGQQARVAVLRPTVILSASRTSRLCNATSSNGPALDGLRARANQIEAVVLPSGETLPVR